MQSRIAKKKPLVSIVVPVYNSEKYLHKCIESLINQTLENIEIIAVDDGSSDGSLLILKEYAAMFPDKIVVKSIPHVNGAGAPRNVAIEIARGDYVAFCDSDDMMDSQAVELLYYKAIEGDYDIVCAPAWHITDTTKVLYGVLKEPISTEMLILNGQVYLWNKLIHKKTLRKAGKMPENITTEDLGYSPILHSYARKIGYLDYPVYYYYKRYGSDSNTVCALRNLDRIKTRRFAISKCNPMYRQYVLAYIARSINLDIRKRWIFSDRVIKQLKELWPELENNTVLKNDEYLYNRLLMFNGLPDNPIPHNVFIGGFGERLSDKLIKQIEEKAFYDGCNLIVLDEKNCNINEKLILKAAYDVGEFEFLNGYFAVKAILQQGGIYLDRRIIIDNPFNYVRYCKVFFSLLDEETYSDWVFGGMPENVALRNIFETYNELDLYENVFCPLKSRIKDILVKYKISLMHVNNLFDYPVTVFSPDVMVCNIADSHSLQPEPHICTHDFSDKTGDVEYITIKKSTLKALINVPGANDELNEVKKENAMLRNKIKNMEFTEEKEHKDD